MKVIITFVGDQRAPNSDPASLTVRGVEFPKGTAVPLEIGSPEGLALIAKLRGNHHFRVEDVPAEPEKLAKPEKPAKGGKAAPADKDDPA